jgi:hypothetical protein
VRASGVPYTVVCPVFFMQNWEFMREPILGARLFSRSTRRSLCR